MMQSMRLFSHKRRTIFFKLNLLEYRNRWVSPCSCAIDALQKPLIHHRINTKHLGIAMMKTVVLICALGTARPDCSMETAVSVIQGPDASHSAQCGFLGQAYLASTAMTGYLLDGEHYLKILCTPESQREPRRADKPSQHIAADALP
jgi:hypothetical protein